MKRVIWSALSVEQQRECLARPACNQDATIQDSVRTILADVQEKGDAAVKEYTQRFDGIVLDCFTVLDDALVAAEKNITTEAKEAIDRAYNNIRSFHEKQGFGTYQVETMPGVTCKRMVLPIESVGLYVPGGTAPLISTTLMLGVPAQIAECAEKILCTPCDKDGAINPHIVYAAQLCGITKIFKIGGAQAIAAMAYGSESVPKVDKIFGPGSAYVTAAKMQVSQDPNGAAIDIPAGPSEVCVIADETANPVFAASDLLSQAEHDVLSQVMLIATSEGQIEVIEQQLQKQLETLLRKEIAAQALENSLFVVVNDMEEAVSLSNRYAPEHLILCVDMAEKYIGAIKNAGSVFVGAWTPESAGDYASGTNHVLPTYGTARSYSGLGVEAFQKTMTVQNITEKGLKNLGPSICALAELEGLHAHARAVSLRLERCQ